MISTVFETERFRVHITGKAAWVEAKEGANWAFRNWHALPVSANCGDSEALKAAVEHYEASRRGDDSLRSALTGSRREPAKPVLRQPTLATAKPRLSDPAARGGSRSKKPSSHHGFRVPLRPPLLAQVVPSPDPNCSNS